MNKKNTDTDNPNFDSRSFCKNPIPKKLAIFGSRSIADERVIITIMEEMQKGFTHILTSQEPGGVCECAQKVAKQYGYPLQCHFLNMQYLRGAFDQRSKEVIVEADEFLIIHDGQSKGTENELKLVKKSGKPYRYEILEKSEFNKSVGFNIKEDWDTAPDELDQILHLDLQ
jgi:hypothetical protein